MKANYENKINPTSQISLGNLYDINKQLMEKEPEINQDMLEIQKDALNQWLQKYFNQKYFMLLCHDLRDYTLFNLDRDNIWDSIPQKVILKVLNDIIECMTNRGALLSLSLQDDDVWELWIRNSEGCFAYYLFPYGKAVLEY